MKRRKRALAASLLALPLLLSAADLRSEESLQQDPISIMGNRGLPKTMFIAPWKRLGSPLPSDKFNSTLDREPAPVEREVFRRELDLYRDGFNID
ncbi:MAG: hypothetical protein WA970_03990 [Gammaproteobacteria bacterium]